MPNDFINATENIFKNIAPVTTTIPETATEKGIFSGVGTFFSKIGPLLPWILGIAFFGILIFLAWTFLNKKDKKFQKDYSKESYKEKVRYYSRNPTRISSNKWGWSIALEILVVSLSVIVALLLFGVGWVPKFPTFWVILVPVIFAVALLILNLANPTLWTSFPRALNSKGENIGFMLSSPEETPDGFLETLVFKKTKWLIFKQVDILSVPTKDKFVFPVKDGKTGKTTNEIFKIDIPVEERFKILGTGDLLVNCPSFFGTRFHIYPNFSDKSKTFDFRDLVFMKEKKDGDLINFSDMSNEFRENAVILAGGNPHNRISGGDSNPKKDNYEDG